MKKLLAATATTLLLLMPIAKADPKVKGWKTADSMGCLMMRECTDEVTQLSSVDDLQRLYPSVDFSTVAKEADALIKELQKMGVDVYLGADKYFPRGNAGVYYTVGNDFFLNESYVTDPQQMLQTLRHEAWHAAQDAFAGTIENNSIAIIYPEENVPRQYALQADAAYAGRPGVLPWEREAKWAGGTPNMTLNVLKVINETDGKPWTVIKPTPLTEKWLRLEGFM